MQHARRARGHEGGCRTRLLRYGLVILALAATATVAVPAAGRMAPTATPQSPRARAAAFDPFRSRGMWVWILDDSNGGSLSSIITTARRYQVHTLYIKSGDGSSMLAQFNRQVVSTLRGHGINVCAWQFVYGNYPSQEAQVGADAVKDGANCLVIDAEGQYEAKYVQAQTYIRRLRQLIGTSFPLALAGLPYIDYHPAFPYSVFLGPGGAQYNLPQMYWRDIGTSVDQVYAHAYLYNRLYLRPIDPLGQVYGDPPTWQILRFRQFLHVYGAYGVSWWDWQESPQSSWSAISRFVGSLSNAAAVPGYATISKGAAGDLVVWAQEHLLAAGQRVAVDGGYGAQTQAAVESFQLTNGLSADGIIGTQTWAALLRHRPESIRWTKRERSKAMRTAPGHKITAAEVADADTSAALRGSSRSTAPVPASALLPARANELAGAGAPGSASPGAGSP